MHTVAVGPTPRPVAVASRARAAVSSFVERHLPVLFPLPAAAFVLLLMVFPIVYNLRISFTEWSMAAARRDVGFANYLRLLGADPRFWPALWRTFYFTAAAVTLETVLGTAIAVLLARDFRGRDTVRTLMLLPVVATPVAVGLVWLLLFEPTIGLLNFLLGALHVPPQRWLASPVQVIPSLVLVDVWQWTPMVILLVLAGLTALPADPLEAARVDGAAPWQSLVYVTLPMLRPTIVAAVMLRSIDALKTFDIIYTMTQGGPGFSSETLNMYGFTTAFQYFRMGAAAALLVVFFLIVLGVTAALARVRRVEWET